MYNESGRRQQQQHDDNQEEEEADSRTLIIKVNSKSKAKDLWELAARGVPGQRQCASEREGGGMGGRRGGGDRKKGRATR